MNINNINKLIMYISLALFACITLIKLYNHVPWLDEALAWLISESLDFNNVLAKLSNEGHFIIWYLLIMPFAKLNLWYPYPMLIINWLSYFFALIVMWKKAPFNIIAKTIITFSWISLNYYSIVARCYSIGILGLFLIASLYKDQLKKPVLYSILLVLTAHTSLASTIAVIPLSLIFIYNLIKNRQINSLKSFLPIGILAIGVILWFLPFSLYGDSIYENMDKVKNTKILLLGKNLLLYSCYFLSLIFLFIFADKKVKLFIIMTTTQFYIFHTLFYPAHNHLLLFLFIYLIIAYWLTPKLHNIKNNFYYSVPFLIIFAILLFINLNRNLDYTIFNTPKNDLINKLNNKEEKEYIFMSYNYCEIIPYLDKRYNTIIVSHTQDSECLNNNSCAQMLIKDYLKDNKSWTAAVITEKKLNETSDLFNWKKDKRYITVFNKR